MSSEKSRFAAGKLVEELSKTMRLEQFLTTTHGYNNIRRFAGKWYEMGGI